MKVIAWITKPHLDQKTWDVEIDLPGENFGVSMEFKTMNGAMTWLQQWSTQRGVSIDLRNTIA